MQNGTRAPRPFFRLSTPPKQARAPPAKWKARNSEDNRQQLHPIWNRMIEHIRTFMIWDAPTRDRSGSVWRSGIRSEEHTSELQSLMRISYAVFCLKKKIPLTFHFYTSQTPHHNNATRNTSRA